MQEFSKPRLTFRYLGGPNLICVSGPMGYIGTVIPERRETLVDLMSDYTVPEVYWSDSEGVGKNGTRVLENIDKDSIQTKNIKPKAA